jgi:hypothetical protein
MRDGGEERAVEAAAMRTLAEDERLRPMLLEAVRVGLRHDRRMGVATFRAAVLRIRLHAHRDPGLISLGHSLERLLQEHQRLLQNDRIARNGAYDGPRAELLRQKRGSALLRMAEKGQLDEAQLRAAGEIREAHGALAKAGIIDSAAMSSMQLIRVDTSPRSHSFPVSADQTPLVNRVLRWQAQMIDEAVPLAAVLDVVVAEKSLDAAEKAWHLKHSSLPRTITDALDAYAEIAAFRDSERRVQR